MSANTSQKSRGRSFLKIVAAIVGVLFVVFVLIAAILPQFIDVNKYRPELVKVANSYLNGTADIGEFKLSFWRGVDLKVQGLKIADKQGISVLDVNEAHVVLPFTSILALAPELRIILKKPNIYLERFADGTINAQKLLKESPKKDDDNDHDDSDDVNAASRNAKTSSQQPKEADKHSDVPGWIFAAAFPFKLEEANVRFVDGYKTANKNTYIFEKLNILVTGLSWRDSDAKTLVSKLASSDGIKVKLDTLLDVKWNGAKPAEMGFSAKGPLKLESTLQFEEGSQETFVTLLNSKLDLTDLDLSVTGANPIQKRAGVVFTLSEKARVSSDTLRLSDVSLVLADISLRLSGTVDALKSDDQKLDLELITNTIDLVSLQQLAPASAGLDVKGSLKMSAKVLGSVKTPKLSANLDLSNGSFKNAALKQTLRLTASVKVDDSNVNALSVALQASKFNFDVSGSVKNLFVAPQVAIQVRSSELNLDDLLVSSAAASEARTKEAAQATTAPSTAPASAPNSTTSSGVVDYNKMLSELKENPLFSRSTGTVDIDLKKILSTGVVIDSFKTTVNWQRLVLDVRNLLLQAFSGTISGGLQINAQAAKPATRAQLQINQIDTKSLVESKMPIAKNTVSGKINAQLNLNGSGLNRADILSNWNGQGQFDLRDASFSTLDFNKQLKEGVVDKLPQALSDKAQLNTKLDRVGEKKGEYESISTKFRLADGVLNLEDLQGKAHPNKGFDLKGSGRVQLVTYGLDMSLDVIDTYDITKLESKLKDSRYNKFAVSPKIKGTLFEPKFDWGSTLAKLAQNSLKGKAAEQLGKALGGKAPQVLQQLLGRPANSNAAEGAPAQNAAPKPEEAVKDVLKGLFGR